MAQLLVTVLSVRETLHLIPVSEMHAIDTKSYPDYAYCALKDARNHRKDAKIQFVALIASKPEISETNKLTWKVVDRSGKQAPLNARSDRWWRTMVQEAVS